MKGVSQFAVFVIVLLVVVAVLILPRREERLAMLAAEGRHEDVIALIERQLVNGTRDPQLLAALGRSYAALGEYHRAIDTFDAYLTMRGDDLAAQERQAELLLQTGSIDRYLDTLAGVVAANPTASRVTRLTEFYRLHGRIDDEIATLRVYAGRSMLDLSQLERLGAILAERADWDEARRWLELVDDQAPRDASSGRLLLLDVLIQSNEIDQAYRRAQAWMTAWHSPYLSGKLILRMAQSGLTTPASKLTLKYTQTMPEHIVEMTGLLTSKGHQKLAQQMLAQWADHTVNPTGQQLRAFVQASALIVDIHGPLRKFAQLIRSGADPATQALLAEELAKAFGKPALASIRPFMSNDALLTRPLFAAELSLFEGNVELARWFLDRTELHRLSSEQRFAWLALLGRVETDANVYGRLAVLWSAGRLPEELLPPFAMSKR